LLVAGLGLLLLVIVASLFIATREGATPPTSPASIAPLAASEQPPPLPSPAAAPVAASYVGASRCQSCHESEFKAWSGSHHQLAMQDATAATVLGDFADVSINYQGVA